MDCDPDGIDIHRCYATPTKATASESNDAVPEIQWLGVDIIEWLGNKAVMARCLSLTKRDRGRAKGMLGRMVDTEDDDSSVTEGVRNANLRAKRCLQTMLMLGMKMEIQAVDDTIVDGGLVRWLERKMWGTRGY